MHAGPPDQPPTIRLAHSPDSDDLVMWWPLTGMKDRDGVPVAGPLGQPRVDTEGLRFHTVAADVEALNRAVLAEAAGTPAAARPDLDVTAVSAAAYPRLAARWRITRCGGSFGEGYGPKVVVRGESSIAAAHDLRGRRIAVPGRNTSAFRTLTLLLGESAFDPLDMVFSEVPGAVVSGRAEAGLLIHEAQLTFERLGLRAVVDLGRWWTDQTKLPLPLGLNVVRRDLDERFGPGTVERVARVLGRSVRYAVDHAEESRQYLRLHAGEDRPEWRDEALVRRYLEMYVSRMSVDLGDRGVEALQRFLGPGVRIDAA